MKRFIISLILIVTGLACFGNVPQDRLEKFEAYLEEVQEAYHIPGMACILYRSLHYAAGGEGAC